MALVLLTAGVRAAPVSSEHCRIAGCLVGGSLQPVCGDDGITYLSRCLAECQGSSVVAQGPCSAAAGAVLAQPPATPVSMDIMARFEEEGFRWAGP